MRSNAVPAEECCMQAKMSKDLKFCVVRKMLHAEGASLRKRDRVRHQNSKTANCTPSFIWREKVAEWCYNVVDHLNEKRSVVYVAMNTLDRFFSNSTTVVDERTYQAASMTALFLAIRASGSRRLSVQELISMGRGDVSTKDVRSVMSNIVNILSWDDPLITPHDFIRVFCEMVPKSIGTSRKELLRDSATYLIEISVFDVELSQRAPSEVACAALLNCIQSQCNSELLSLADKLKAFAIRDPSELSAIRRRLLSVYEQSSDGSRSNVITDDEGSVAIQVPSHMSAITYSVSEAEIAEVDNLDGPRKRSWAPHEAETRPVSRSKRARTDLQSLAHD